MKRIVSLLIILSLGVSGCSLNLYKTTSREKVQIKNLEEEVEKLASLRKNDQTVIMQKESQLAAIQKELQGSLKDDKRVTLELQEKGLVITLADNILFDSGKAKIKKDAYSVLDDIAGVINTTASDRNVGIEGHTDNVAIKYSKWKSNRELSTARANNVYHYLVEKGIQPSRITTMGYGQYRPIEENNSEEGRAKNRRVEIVILPEFSREVFQEEVIVAEEYIK